MEVAVHIKWIFKNSDYKSGLFWLQVTESSSSLHHRDISWKSINQNWEKEKKDKYWKGKNKSVFHICSLRINTLKSTTFP